MPLFWARCRSTSGQSGNIISKSRPGLSSDRLCIRRRKIIEPLPLAITISLISSVSSHRRATRKWHFKSYSSSYWGGAMPQRARELRVIKMSFSCTLSRGTTAADATRCDLLELPSSYQSTHQPIAGVIPLARSFSRNNKTIRCCLSSTRCQKRMIMIKCSAILLAARYSYSIGVLSALSGRWNGI